ncbi:hypothetical protein D3C73_74220 [compost metagenome]
MSPIYIFTLSLLALAALLALIRGSGWERSTAAVLVLGWTLSWLTPFDFKTPPWPAIIADACVFLFLLYGALQSRRLWMAVAAGFQCLVLATHYVFVERLDLDNWAYISAYYVWNIGVIGTLCAASLLRPRKARLSGRLGVPKEDDGQST